MIPPPRDPTARAIFDALVDEQEKRPGRSVEEWKRRELDAVWKTVCALAGRPVPREEVEAKESMAAGHVDYTHKVAYYCADLVTKQDVK